MTRSLRLKEACFSSFWCWIVIVCFSFVFYRGVVVYDKTIGDSSVVFALATTTTPTPTVVASSSSSSPSRQSRTRTRTVLVTGGCGYIGSHTCLELLNYKGVDDDMQYQVVAVDNLDNSKEESLIRVRKLMLQQAHSSEAATTTITATLKNQVNDNESNQRLFFRKCDIRHKEELARILDDFPDISSCIHFAGLKAVGESVASPLAYYNCNIGGTVSLLELLQERNISNFVFSSSATVYGEPEVLPIVESSSRLQATNPYGRTKLFIEEILRDTYASQPTFWNTLILRYFNPIGAHSSGRIGEDPTGIPNNLMPFIAQVCVGRRKELKVFGNDYDTVDGTGVRDYIHVVDLAKGHVAALNKLYSDRVGCVSVNLGTGQGVSVLQLIDGMSKATGNPVPYAFAPRRPGDVAVVYADATLANDLLGWKAELGVKEMCEDTWKWQSENPFGYVTNTDTIQQQAYENSVEEVQPVSTPITN